MNKLVLIGEGHGEVEALPILVSKLLKVRAPEGELLVDRNVLRLKASRIATWDGVSQRSNYEGWTKMLHLASKRRNVCAILAVFDGDFRTFPPGSPHEFCATSAARGLAMAARAAGAGVLFSLAVVFACVEFESWLIAGLDRLAGSKLDNRLRIPTSDQLPKGDPESHGKAWLERHCPGYRPTLHQARLTEAIDLKCLREKRLRSFLRLEHALTELRDAVGNGQHAVSPVG